MGARIRHTEGVSWRAGPGVRRWRSTSVSVGAGWFGLGWLLWYGIAWPFFIAPLWAVAEFWLLFGTAVLVLVYMADRHQPASDIYLARVGPFWVFDLWQPP
jgi:hypothetical protein